MNKWLKIISLWIFAVATNLAANDQIYTGWLSKKAVSGYDTVAFFTEGQPVKGNPKFKYSYLDVEWYFASEKHLNLFKQNPEKYMPQYGGFCAWAVAAKKYRAPGDPKYWKIVDNKLYLNYDRSVQNKWLKDIPSFIKAGDKNWSLMN
ncbi:YHS domain-containing (seleno)protein [Endozoicomonas ascidiicola]|uniref:YHS domain-containing (seleno)protein n=1 Tax=Endozoicomonas ascidiicola TaxID=1698521 RepID=UPI00082EF92C|nr:YHS domain-containing (seleno)protein [Endozoicomonas ascidiicola]